MARVFLGEYLRRNNSVKWPHKGPTEQKNERARMIRSFEQAMLVRFPELHISRELTNSILVPTERANFPAVSKAQQRSPALAGSLKSNDLSSFRRAGVRAKLQLNKMARGSWSTSSFLSRGGSLSGMSIAGISDISASFRSLSIHSESVSGNRAS